MIRLKNIIYSVAFLFLTGCGEYFAQEWPEEYDPEVLPDVTGLGADEGRSFVLYVGDEYKLNPQVGDKFLDDLQESDKEIVLSRFHASADCGDSIVRVRQTEIVALNVGKDVMSFSNFDGSWTAKVPVSVLPGWINQRMAGWRYETIVYAKVTVNGEAPTTDMKFAAFCGDELRGRGVTRTVKGITYMVFRVGSNTNERETIRFEGFDSASGSFISFDETLTFDGGTHGTLSNLFELNGKK